MSLSTLFRRTAFGLLLAVPIGSGLLVAMAEPQQKTLGVVPVTSQLQLSVIPEKNRYIVDEPLRLLVSGNKPFYLYLFSIDSDTDEAVLILPNRLQTDNRYGLSDKAELAPQPPVEFFSDRAGPEKLLIIASESPLPLDPNNFKYVGDFLHGKSRSFEKSLGVKFKAQPAVNTRVVKELVIPIEPAAVETSDHEPPSAFVAGRKRFYTDGETLRVLYGADQPGWMVLFGIDPDGKRHFLMEQAIDGRSVYSYDAVASLPLGEYTVFGIFSPDQADSEELWQLITKDGGERIPQALGLASYKYEVTNLR